MKKRVLSLLLILLLCLTAVPALGAPEISPADDVWAAIGALEENELPKRPSAADCEGLMPKVEALVTAREDYMPGSAQYRDG
ncbi:MAG: hypothetical protein IIZ19_02660, partial [Clostridia bacterium]|nr:hypothetical protein [Clostridia bacterium]